MNKCKNCRKQINSADQHVECYLCLENLHSRCAKRGRYDDCYYCAKCWASRRGIVSYVLSRTYIAYDRYDGSTGFYSIFEEEEKE